MSSPASLVMSLRRASRLPDESASSEDLCAAASLVMDCWIFGPLNAIKERCPASSPPPPRQQQQEHQVVPHRVASAALSFAIELCHKLLLDAASMHREHPAACISLRTVDVAHP